MAVKTTDQIGRTVTLSQADLDDRLRRKYLEGYTDGVRDAQRIVNGSYEEAQNEDQRNDS